MEPTGKPKRKPDYRLELVENEIMLYNPADTKIISFNPTASLLWQLCGGEATIQEMIDALQEEYPDAKDEIAGDVMETLQQLLDIGCIEMA
jgi:hypothetical protein